MWSPGWLAWFVAMVAEKTGWSFKEIMWEVPASVTMQIYDVAMSQHVELRWMDSSIDIDAIIDG